MTAVSPLREISRRIVEGAFAPPPSLRGSEWAEQNRVLSTAESALPGAMRFDDFPFLCEIQDVLCDETTRRIVFVKPTQIGATELGNTAIGFKMHLRPSGMIVAFPTDKLLKQWSTLKLDPMIRSTVVLRDLIGEDAMGGGRDKGDTMTRKLFANGFLIGVTSGSISDLRSVSAPWLDAEELDAWGPELKDQGDPLKQFEARSTGFRTRKLYLPCTPTILGSSRIWKEYEKSDYRRYFVPCPHCNGMQQLVWQDDQGRYRLIFDKDAGGQAIPESVQYLCEHCGSLIEQRWRAQMIHPDNAKWIALKPENAPYAAGFQLGRLYSPLTSWADLVREFLGSKDSPATLQTFVNLWLGLPFEETADRLRPQTLSDRAEEYGVGVDAPAGVGLITSFIDVQGDRVEIFFWGWGVQEERWAIAWEIVSGDPGQPELWQEVDEVLSREWIHASGARLRTSCTAIDAGYLAERVHNYCESRSGVFNIFPTIGRDGRGRPLLQPPRPQKYRRKGESARPNWVVGVDSLKDIFFSDLRVGARGPRCVHFRSTMDEVFYDHLTSERIVTVYVKSQPVRVYRKYDNRANEGLDGAVGAHAAVYKHLGHGVAAKLAELVTQISEKGSEYQQAAVTAAPSRKKARRELWKGFGE